MVATRSVTRRTLQQLEQEVLPEFLRARGWMRRTASDTVSIGERMVWSGSHGETLLTFVHTQASGHQQRRFALPLTLVWDDTQDTEILRTAEWTLARVRERSRVGMLVDAFADPAFCAGIVRAVAADETVAFTGGKLRFAATSALSGIDIEKLAPVQHFGSDQLESKVALGESVLLKVYRLAEPGINPDIEMSGYLTRAGFTRIAALVGSVTCEMEGAPAIALAALHTCVRHQGNAWTFTRDHLDRFAAELRSGSGANDKSPHTLFDDRMRTMGRCIGELHRALCADSSDPAFAVEPMATADLSLIEADIAQLADRSMVSIQQQLAQWTEPDQILGRRWLELRSELRSQLQAAASQPIHAMKMRHHGNLQLRKILLVADDFVVVDFDGVLSLALEERRRKQSPLRDVACVLSSFLRARVAALDRTLSAQPDLRDRVEPALEAWRAGARDAFLSGYRHGVGTAACLPESAADTARLLRLFEFEFLLRGLNDDLDRHPASVAGSIAALLEFTTMGPE